MTNRLRTVYMGTPEFAVSGLEALYNSGNEIGFVVTQPDKARDRGKKIQFTPVKEKALEFGLEVVQPETVRGNEEFLQKLRDYNPDLIVVAAYGQILPPEIIHLPRLGCINIHASILPRWRGAAPIQRAIMEGDKETGITLMYMEEGLDTGDMIAKKVTEIGKKSQAELHDELAAMGGELLAEQLPNLALGNIVREKQDDALSTYAKMIFKKDGELNFEKSPAELECLIRGLDPWPGAYSYYNGELFKIWKAEALDKTTDKPNGTILDATAKGIEIAAGGMVLLAEIIQMPGKKRVQVADFLKGNKIEIGAVLKGLE